MSTGFCLPSCQSRISASADERPFQHDAPWNCHVLVVGVWMLLVTLSSAVCPGTVKQKRIQCLEDCFSGQLVLCKGLSPSPVSVWQFVQFFLLARLLAGGTDWMLCVWCRSPSWTEQIPHKQTEVRCQISLSSSGIPYREIWLFMYEITFLADRLSSLEISGHFEK